MGAEGKVESPGAIWEAKTKNGDPKLKIKLDGKWYVALRNNKKAGGSDKQPDWRIMPPMDFDGERRVEGTPKDEVPF